jgi:imidazolonepropionase-like amidohydrolase
VSLTERGARKECGGAERLPIGRDCDHRGRCRSGRGGAGLRAPAPSRGVVVGQLPVELTVACFRCLVVERGPYDDIPHLPVRRNSWSRTPLAGTLFAQPQTAAPTESVTAIRAGTLIDGTGNAVVQDVTILIRNGRIVEVGPNVAVPADAERIDLTGWTVLPGFIDLHTHVTLGPEDLMSPPGSFLYREYPEYGALKGVVNARRTLLAGFTTIRDLGASGTTALALRDAIANGLVPGPRMVTAIVLGTTGSHCDPTTGIRPGHVELEGARTRVYDGAGAAEAAVRRAVRDGADVIKVCATAGVLSQSDDIGPAQMTRAELEAVVSTATMLNRRVAAHAHGIEGIRNAVRAGVTTIDHGSVLDDEILREMKQRGT